ncbi:Glutathione biosynthesis bifunctional protein GshAB [Labeo rohita]|uniref:Glutathione biosynthesis bifunctional protein GshAB n=1 Tax=Labeo rohita TaxID=84645 RepID=A0ABQ8L986_LABRO|nr:Glutathione biosynthesis bifunctional protein GshAB [Labeo rohita]
MAALISDAYLRDARAAMAKKNPAFPQRKTRKSRKRSLTNPLVTGRREKRQETHCPGSAASQSRRRDEEGLQIEDQELASLETRLQEFRDTITADQVPEGTDRMVSAWEQRQLLTDVRMKTARPMLFDAKLSAERVLVQNCHRCCAVEAVIRCLDCVPLDMEYLCSTCDMEAHKRNVFHDREAVFHGFLEPIPPTTAVVVNENGQPQFCEQICQLPVPAPRSICECTHDFTITPGKHISVDTINGRYDVCLPRKSCSSCSAEWTPEVKDLLIYRYWPASTSCQTLYKFDVFTSFEHMKVTAPAMSRQAFLKMLEHRSVQAGRTGSICADTFQRSFFEFTFCQYKEEDMCQVHHFECPACSPDMLAVCSDGNRNITASASQKGRTEEPAIYEGLFLAKDEEVATFVDLVRGNMRSANESAVCGTAKFTAGREMSKKSGAQIDEEGIQVAVCRYWPYLNKVAEGLPELLPLTEMRPFLSVMHAKAHTAKCEVRWGGRSQDGAGNTVGEEVEQVNSFPLQGSTCHKIHDKGWKSEHANATGYGLEQKKEGQPSSSVSPQICQKRVYTPGCTEELRADIENITVTLLRKKKDLYRRHDSNQARQRKKKKMTELKKKLREKVLQYNTVVEGDPIDEELACSLTEGYILPWERHKDGNTFRLKRSIFDQVMLLKRLEEEQSILLKEMSQHIKYLLKQVQEVESLRGQTLERIKTSSFSDLTEDATHGLNSVLSRRGHSLRSQHKQAVNAYSSIATMECDFLSIQEDIEEWDDNGFTSPESEEEDT